ncbi:hypothetical protein EQ836_22380 [Ectopseudomonas mendocina]|uniref:Transposase n=1 Tax=Ectopseudomonas mendocina TaxID=300 RepID=A0ABD7RSF3_ECTME|nr:transposase [Pseudomonas mendocina]TRO10408.1 hypothetical protein EQ829_21525 [Pseudomonas mendocina]TRO12284.1 hypothetical protein EQ836_22380 [Pseudomonas mendocina]
MSNQRYPNRFKIEAVKHITERGLRVADVAERRNRPAKTSGWRGCFRLGSNEVARHNGRQSAALRCVGVTHHDLPNRNPGYHGSRPGAAG